MKYEVEFRVAVGRDDRRVFQSLDIPLTKELLERFVEGEMMEMEEFLEGYARRAVDYNKYSDESDEEAFQRLYDYALEDYQNGALDNIEDYLEDEYELKYFLDDLYYDKVVDSFLNEAENIIVDEDEIIRL